MNPEKGRRISFWLPDNEEWLMDVICSLQRRVEVEYGASISRGEIIRYALKQRYKEFCPKGDVDNSEGGPDLYSSVGSGSTVKEGHGIQNESEL